jgi:hypothetical protein
MALVPRERFSRIEQEYLDILCDEYHGYVPHGELKKIAERLGCKPNYLSRLNWGMNADWKAERDRRIAAMIPLADPHLRMWAMQHMYEDMVKKRKERGLDLTGKDPLEVLEAIRKENDSIVAAQPKTQQNTLVFQFIKNMSGDELSTRIAQVEEMLRSGQFEEEEEVVEAQWIEEIGDGSASGGDATREGQALSSQSEETSEN